MSLSQLDFYNGALLLLKETPLANLNENREARFLLDQEWNLNQGQGSHIFNSCLSEADWLFGQRTQQLQYNQNAVPSFGYPYAFNVPADLVRLMVIAYDPYLRNSLNQYQMEGGYIFCGLQTLYLRWVSNDPAWGMNTAIWPEIFIDYVFAHLAYKIAGKVTGGKMTPEDVRKEKVRLLGDAAGKNAIARPVAFPPRGTWLLSRHGVRGFGWNRGPGG